MGDEVYRLQEYLNIVFGKIKKGSIERNIWKNRSMFFDLPYWSSHNVKHYLDVMHVEKNECDSLIEILINIPGKNKDSMNPYLNMVEMGIRQQQTLEETGKKYFPLACHTLSKKEKKSLCECFPGINGPQGYSSRIKKLVSMKDIKLIG